MSMSNTIRRESHTGQSASMISKKCHFFIRMASSFELSSDQPTLYYQRARKLAGMKRCHWIKVNIQHMLHNCSQLLPKSFWWTNRETPTPVQESFQAHTTRTKIKKTETAARLELRVINTQQKHRLSWWGVSNRSRKPYRHWVAWVQRTDTDTTFTKFTAI